MQSYPTPFYDNARPVIKIRSNKSSFLILFLMHKLKELAGIHFNVIVYLYDDMSDSLILWF